MNANPRIRTVLNDPPVGERVTLQGWVKTRRSTRKRSFIELSDGSSVRGIQVIAEADMSGYEETVAPLTTASSIEVDGIVSRSPGGEQAVELQAECVRVITFSPAEYPLQKKRHSFEFLREMPHLRGRTTSIAAVMRIRHTLSNAIHRFFDQQGFYYIHTPLITAMDCEGAGEQFTVTAFDPVRVATEGTELSFTDDFFGTRAFLTVSGQLEAESYACALKNVYTFGPTFRAENSHTARHLAEFWMVEPEMAFCDITGDMDTAEAFLHYIANAVLEENDQECEFLEKMNECALRETLSHIRTSPFIRMSYSDALDILQKSDCTFEYPLQWGCDLQSEHERALIECSGGTTPVMITDFPADIKPFYMKDNPDGRTVRALDCVVPGLGELIGGSERETNRERLEHKMRAAGMNIEDYDWYLQLRMYGGVPHAGFGLGFDRLVQFCTGMHNIRDVIPFPRAPGTI